MKQAHVSAMTRLWLALAAMLAAALTVGCTSTGTTGDGGGYSSKGSRGGGWENFRAEMPTMPGSAMPGSAMPGSAMPGSMT